MRHLHLFALLIVVFSCQSPEDNRQSSQKSENVGDTQEKEAFVPGKNRVTFESEDQQLVGDLYLPADYQEGKTYPAVVVGGSWTTVKEQMAGLYAQELAERGFVALAFDHRYYGESEGEPRFVEIPADKSEDFIHAMDYLTGLSLVNTEKTAGLSVCASGGYMAASVAEDKRFKAFAMVVPWFNTDEVVNAFYGGEEGIKERLAKAAAAQKTYEETGEMTYIASISETDPNAAMYGPFDYYLDPKLGKVPNWSADKFALVNWTEWLNYRPVAFAEKIDTPTLIITSKEAATPAAGEAFYELLKGPKDLQWMEGGQLDFYHKDSLVNPSMDQVASHFEKYL